jgi:putative Holliday junction resolvase
MSAGTPNPARVMGIDFGERRVGLALSDLTGTLAGGLATLEVTGIRDAAEKAAAAAAEHNAALIVVGYPLNMNGTAGASAEKAAKFAERLRGLTGVTVVLSDERLTTSLAHVYLNASNVNKRKKRGVVDMAAAQIILQNYLDSKR